LYLYFPDTSRKILYEFTLNCYKLCVQNTCNLLVLSKVSDVSRNVIQLQVTVTVLRLTTLDFTFF
jgi:hypothetical protein